MDQLDDVIKVVLGNTNSLESAGELLFDLLCALNWDIEGVGNEKDAAVFLEIYRSK